MRIRKSKYHPQLRLSEIVCSINRIVGRRTIVRDSFRILVDDLQQEFRDSNAWNSPNAPSDWFWKTTFELKAPGHWILSVSLL